MRTKSYKTRAHGNRLCDLNFAITVADYANPVLVESAMKGSVQQDDA